MSYDQVGADLLHENKELRESLRLTERHWCLALLAEGPDAIQRITRRVIEQRDGALVIPDPACLLLDRYLREQENLEDEREMSMACPECCAGPPPCFPHNLCLFHEVQAWRKGR